MLHRSLNALPGKSILSPGRIAFSYFILAGLWIYGSDRLLLLIVGSGWNVTYAQTLKGWIFVVGTSLLLYMLLRRWESVIVQSEDELRGEQQRYKALIEAAPTPILTLDRDGRITMWSPAAEAVLGWREEEVLGRWPPHVPEDQLTESKELLKRVLDGKGVRDVETRRLRKDGTLIDVSLSAVPFGDASIRGVEVTLIDITDRKRYEEGLIEAKERAEEMNRIKSAFLTNMSHEIRTPLTAIMGFSDILRSEADGRVREDAEHIFTSGERLMDTLGSLLDLAEIESEEVTLHPKTFDLCELARPIIARYERQAQAQGLTVRFDRPADPMLVRLDPDAVERVLANLLSNAVKFTHEGHVSLALRRLDNAVELRVADTGVGIAEEALVSIFEAFQQESSGHSREFEGSGLGLTIVRHLVDMMDGTIDVASAKGEGTTFTVRLPLEGARTTVETAADVSAAPTRGAGARREEAKAVGEEQIVERRILLVEDNPANRLVVRAFVGDEDTIDVAVNGRDAIRRARSIRYDIVLLDISLGAGPGGPAVMEELRSLPGYEQVAIVALTAHAMPGDRERFLNVGFDGYLGKPFSRAQLTAALRLAACVRRARGEAEVASREVSLEKVLHQCQQRGLIDRYDREGDAVTLTHEGVTVRLTAHEARAVLQLLGD